MRTTVDFPDALFRQLKSRAAQEGISMKELLTRALINDLARPAGTRQRTRVGFPLLDSSEPGVLNPTNADIDALLA